MTDMIRHGELGIARVLYDFVNTEALPGTGVSPEHFWSGAARIVNVFAPKSRALVAERAALQGTIDDWHRARRGKPHDPEEYRAFLADIGYLAPEGMLSGPMPDQEDDLDIARGFAVLGPTVQNGAVVNGPVREVADLPAGWGDDQDAGRYRLRRRDDGALFGYASGAQSAKPVFFPTEEVLWRGRRTGEGFTVEPDGPTPQDPRYALLGVRSCDLTAVGIHDTVLLDRGHQDAGYAARRDGAFVVAVTCGSPGGTCFCVSMGTGPRPGAGYDLALTEILDDGAVREETGKAPGIQLAREGQTRCRAGPGITRCTVERRGDLRHAGL